MRYVYFALISIFLVILVILYNFVTSASGYTATIPQNDGISIILEMMNMIVALIAIVVISGSIQKFEDIDFGHVLLYFTFGTFLLTIIRLFLMLEVVHIMPLSEETVGVGWHAIFYLAAFCFLAGTRKLYLFTKQERLPRLPGKAYTLGSLLTVIGLIILATAHTLDGVYVKLFSHDLFYTFGLHHFIAFMFAGLIAFYLWKAKKQSPSFKPIINAFLIAFIFLSLVHAWELIGESWKLITIDPEIAEHVEQSISLVGYIFIVAAYLQKLPEGKQPTTS